MSLGMETICSIYGNTKQINITFYLFQEIVIYKLNTAYTKKLFKMGCTNLKFNQKEFSKLLGISPSDISEIENGTKYPIRSQFVKLRKIIKLQNI